MKGCIVIEKLEINIVGEGSFGTFLKEQFGFISHLSFNPEAFHTILCVPFENYGEVAEKYKDRHLINICSVQEESIKECLKHTDNVTGLHPLFGKRSPVDGRTAILTRECEHTWDILELFQKINCKIVSRINGEKITPIEHDRIMYLTHYKGIELLEKAGQLVKDCKDIPEECMPTSFKKIKELSKLVEDMPEGTLSSIKANPFCDK